LRKIDLAVLRCFDTVETRAGKQLREGCLGTQKRRFAAFVLAFAIKQNIKMLIFLHFILTKVWKTGKVCDIILK
jgi:hypothetical protein